jgi:hypothetical protein
MSRKNSFGRGLCCLYARRLMGSNLTVSPSPRRHRILVDSKPEDCTVLVLFAAGSLLDEIVGVFELAHKQENEALVMVSFEIVQINTALLREVLEVFPESACWPEAL